MQTKTSIALLFVVALAFMLIPAAALASGMLTVTGGVENTDYKYEDGGRRVTVLTGTPLTLSGRPSAASVVIDEGVEANLTLDNATINTSAGAAIHTFSGAKLNLTVVGDNTLTGTYGYAGLNVNPGQTLVITAKSTGTINVTGGHGGAGIGGNNGLSGGTIIIWGGTVIANGGSFGAGIGGGMNGSGGEITISGGTVTTQSYSGAGIGGGEYGDGGKIIIQGGTVTARSLYGGAGIGGGIADYLPGGDGGTIIIRGGTVTATSVDAAGIGGGDLGGDGGEITISGGTVNATALGLGAGIGGGMNGSGGEITISGGTVTASGLRGAGIGSAAFGSGGVLKVTGGMVFAKSSDGEDVGSGDFALASGSLEISGDAALFLKNGTCLSLITTTHTRETFTDHTADTTVYGISVPWADDFSAYLRLYTLSYDANGGSGNLPAAVTQHINTKTSVAGGGELRRTGYTFGGWNTAANGGGTDFAANATFTFPENDVTLFGKWTPPYSEPLPTPTSRPMGTIINCRSGVNVRSRPGTNYPILGFAPRGAAYTVMEKVGAWYKVEFEGQVGYISAHYLAVSAPGAGHGMVVNCNHSVNVRSGPGKMYSILGFAPRGAAYPILKKAGSWYQIEFNGRTAYLSADYLSAGNG
ncbi:MAG: SH3 domain-containing protein [Candidatus Pelethousia sp.]|nr:SH3 domain-containing protein [Candidatus Pelethousia sp.]